MEKRLISANYHISYIKRPQRKQIQPDINMGSSRRHYFYFASKCVRYAQRLQVQLRFPAKVTRVTCMRYCSRQQYIGHIECVPANSASWRSDPETADLSDLRKLDSRISLGGDHSESAPATSGIKLATISADSASSLLTAASVPAMEAAFANCPSRPSFARWKHSEAGLHPSLSRWREAVEQAAEAEKAPARL